MGSEKVNKQRKGLALQSVSAAPHHNDKYSTKEKQQTLCTLLYVIENKQDCDGQSISQIEVALTSSKTTN